MRKPLTGSTRIARRVGGPQASRMGQIAKEQQNRHQQSRLRGEKGEMMTRRWRASCRGALDSRCDYPRETPDRARQAHGPASVATNEPFEKGGTVPGSLCCATWQRLVECHPVAVRSAPVRMRVGGRGHGHSRPRRDLSDLVARERHSVRMPRVGDVEGDPCARTELRRGNYGNVSIRVIICRPHQETLPELVGVGVGPLGLPEPPPQPTVTAAPPSRVSPVATNSRR